jgi:hypothetical protein
MLTAVFFVIIGYIVLFQKNTGNQFTKDAIDRYENYYHNKAKDSLGLLETGDLESIRDSLGEWEHVKKGDRIYPFKRSLLLRLCSYLELKSEYSELAKWAETWVSLDDRDVTGTGYYYEAVRHLPERSEEGISGLAEQWKRFPKNDTLSMFYILALMDEGEVETANHVIRELVERAKWQIFWSEDSGFSEQNSAKTSLQHLLGERWGLKIDVPEGTSVLRVDLPAKVTYGLSSIEVSLGDKIDVFHFSEVNTHQMKEVDGWLVASGENDPYFRFRLKNVVPLSTREEEHLKVSFKLKYDVRAMFEGSL